MATNKILQSLSDFTSKKIIIFGSSEEGRIAANIIASYGIKVDAFIDNHPAKIGNKTFDIKIVHPKALTDMENFIVIVPSIYYKEMFKQLIDMGIPKKSILNIDIYDKTNIKFDMPYKLKFYLLFNKFFCK